MTYLPDLRESLVKAAARQHPAPASDRGWRAALGTVAVAAAVIIALTVVGIAVILLRHGPQQPQAPAKHAAVGAVPGRQQLIDTLAVLRRPQTAADRDFPKFILRPRAPLAGGSPDIPLIRYATTTPWGQRLFFVPFKPLTAAQLARVKRQNPRLPRRFLQQIAHRGETLSVFSSSSGAGGATAAKIRAFGISETEGAGRAFAGGSTQARLIEVVPDGVSKVQFVLARQPNGNQYGAKTYAHVLKMTVPVHNNVAAVQVNRECCGNLVMIWYAADGHAIKQIGSLGAANRVTAPPKPGPQTPQSRAAQRNPSTPNRVWVTPLVGGPHTNFEIHFRVLLNGADYSYHFYGTSCPHFTFPGGTGKPNALRGDLWTDPIRAAVGQPLCAGTYHVAVTVMDLGRAGNPKQPARPFGTGTFTVR
ncbi:MAG: hypothetical protein ACYCXW_04100 [Solirubrobacteraceae bacterium]